MENNSDFEYSGTDNLEVMTEARNYNACLSRLVERHIAGAKSIVDFGAGIGTFARPIHSSGRDVTAVEPDEQQRRIISALGIRALPDISSVPDGWADAIYTVNVLEHIEDDVSALRDLHAKLKPSGRVFIYVPAFQVLYSSMDRKVGHFRRYDRAELVSKAVEAGFHVRDARYVDSLGFLASLLYKWMGNDSGDINRQALKTYDRFVFPLSRIIDTVSSRWFGKNLCLLAEKSVPSANCGKGLT